MTKGESFIKSGKCKHGHRSAMSNSAWCDLNKNCTVLKSHDMCHNPKCNSQKQIAFTPKQFQLEGGLIKSKLQKIFRGTQTAWTAGVEAKIKKPKSAQITSNTLRSSTSGKILTLTDLHGLGLRLRVM